MADTASSNYSRDVPILDFNFLDKKDILGHGGFGVVYRCTYKGYSKDVAIKLIMNGSETKAMAAEASLLAALSHPNIIRLFGTCKTDKGWCLVMELANLGSLSDQYQKLSELQRAKVCFDISTGLNYLHDKNVIHRDMKMDNVLIMGDLAAEIVAKISDFGLSRISQTYMTRRIGTMAYMAPELADDEKYTKSIDVYSLAIIIFEVYTDTKFKLQCTSYGFFAIMKAVKASVKPPIPYHLPKKLIDLISKGWSKVPQNRPELKVFIEVFEDLIESFSHQEELPEDNSSWTIQRYVTKVGANIFPSPIFSKAWNAELEEMDSMNLRKAMVQDIKTNYARAKYILPHVYEALSLVPKHIFHDFERTPGNSRREKLQKCYNWNLSMATAGGGFDGQPGFLGLQITLLSIDVGKSILTLEAYGYIEALICQLIGPKGLLTCVDFYKNGLETAEKIMDDSSNVKNYKYIYSSASSIDDLITKLPQILPIGKQFDSIRVPAMVKTFPDNLKYLLKDGGVLLAGVIPENCEEGNLQIYTAGNPRLRIAPEHKTITDFTVHGTTAKDIST